MLIEVRDLGHRFDGAQRLFGGMSFTLEEGSLVAIAGPSGSGKTTLLTLLAGWVAPAEGQIIRRADLRVSWVPQNPVGVAQRTAIDHVALALMLQGKSRSEAMVEALAALLAFGLAKAADRPFGTLSGGEAQRLMLARASLTTAELLLIDEPTAQLDPATAAMVAETLVQLAGAGRAVVIASHDPRVLAACSTTVDLAL